MESVATGITFRLPRLKCIPRQFEKYIHGEWIDRNPLAITAEFDDESLQISYDYKESLRIVVPWEIEGLGVFFLKTVSLPKRDKPYDLVLEVARGTVGRLIDQAENWKAGGLKISAETESQLDLVKRNLRRATFCAGDERFQFATVAIGASIHLMNEVGTYFSRFVFDFRRKDKQPNTSLLGAPWYLGEDSEIPDFHQCFNTAIVPAGLSDDKATTREEVAELCQQLHRQGTTTCGAPILPFRNLDSARFSSIDEAECWMIDQGSRSLDLGLSHCKLLMPVANLGCRNHAAGDSSDRKKSGWNDQEQVHLTFELTRYLKEKASQIPQIVGIDQPFGEGQIGTTNKSPLQLADTLIRMEAPIAAFCLEINLGYYPEGTWIRDLFAFNDLLDTWSQFDYPLIIQLRIPGGIRSIEESEDGRSVAAGYDSQASWLEKISLLALAKQNVAGVFYAQIFDSPQDTFYGAGLISSQKNVKPAMDALRKVRQSMA